MAREQYFVLFHDNQCKIKHYDRHLNIYPSQKQAIADASVRTKTVKKVIMPRCWFQEDLFFKPEWATRHEDEVPQMARDAATRVEERSVESSASAVEWGSIFAGGIAALGITVILLTLGPGFGLTAVSPWSYKNPTPAAFGTAAATGL